MPHGRVLFECDHCHFVNLFGTLCLWCAHSCTPQPSLGTEVRRRASQPHLLNDRQKEQLRRMDAPRQASPTGCMSVPEQRQLHFADLEAPEERRKRHRDAKVFSVEVVEKDEAVSPVSFLYRFYSFLSVFGLYKALYCSILFYIQDDADNEIPFLE